MVAGLDGKRNILGQNYMKKIGIITRKYLGLPFESCNCLTLIYNICNDLELKVPDNYKGYDLGTYMAYWEEKPREAIADMMEVLKTIGEKANVKLLLAGDIVVIKYRNTTFPAIYVGAGNIMASTREKGVIAMPISTKFKILMARRIK